MHRRAVLRVILGGLGGLSGGSAFAQQGLIRIVVPYAAGGTTDTMARLLAIFLQKKLGRSVIVENRPGAAGLIATRYVQSASPDGNTLLFHNSGIVVQPLILKSAGYDVRRDLTPVCSIAEGPSFLMVNDTVPAKTLLEFIEYVRNVPDGLECANSGVNSGGHIAALLFEKQANVKLLHVPYKGSAEVAVAMLSGQVKMQISTSTETLIPHVATGKIRLLGVASSRRTMLAPDVPTMGDYLPGYRLDSWFGLLAPANTPIEIRESIAGIMRDALSELDIRERFMTIYMEPKFLPPQQFAENIDQTANHYQQLVRELGLSEL